MGVPVVTFECTMTAPANATWVAVPSAVISVTSVRKPLPVLTATRAATSLPSGEDGITTAAGDLSATSCASTSAFGATRNSSTSGDSATYTFCAPYSPSASFTPAAVPGAAMTTADGSPSARAAVSASRVVLRTPSPAGSSSTRTRTSAMTMSPLPGSGSDDLLGGEEADELLRAVALVGDLHALALGRAAGEVEHLAGGVGQADAARLDTEVGERLGLHRLLLRGHDPLEGGVARLVDRVPGRHDRRQRRLHG